MTIRKNKYLTHRFENGLRAVVAQTDGVVSYCGVVVNAGSRDESLQCRGLAHFVEHTIFKGTRKRKGWQITDRMERVGGDLNAYTSKEETVIYTSAPSGYIDRSFELLSDIIANSSFPAQDLEMEKDVVIEEIKSYLDSPADNVLDEFEELIYEGSAMAHNILGDESSVRGLTSVECLGFLDRFYTPENMVVYCSDPGDPEKNMRLLGKYFGKLQRAAAVHDRVVPPVVPIFDKTRDYQSHQANTIVGARAFDRNDPRRFALFLLNNYLAGPCMNSRLNRELREKRGYVYTVDSNVSLLSDCGAMLVYFGCEPSKVSKCKRIIANEIDRLAQSPLSQRKFTAVRDQYCGQVAVSSDNRESVVMSLGKGLLYYDEIRDVEAMVEAVRAVTAEDVCGVAQMIAANGLSSLTLI